MSTPVTDLTQRPPRSPRVRLGGYAILPRALDKGRATLAGKNGPYHFACPLDQRFLNFAGIDPDALLEQLKLGKGDTEILEWITANATNKPSIVEIKQWSSYVDTYTPGDVETFEYFVSEMKRIGTAREDICGFFDLLDLDDYVSYGGLA